MGQQIEAVPVTNLIRAAEAGAADPLVSTCEPSRCARAAARKRYVEKADGDRKQDSRRPLTSVMCNRWIAQHSGGAMIPVMKAADLRDRNDAPARWRLHLAPMGAVVVEGLMRARGV